MQNQIENTEIIDQLLKSDLGKDLQRQIVDEKLTARRALLSEVHKQKLRLKELPAINKKIEDAKKAMDKAEKTFKSAEDEYRSYHREHYSLTGHVNARINRFRKELRNTAPSYINECLQWISAEESKLRNISSKEGATVDRTLVNVETGKAPREHYSRYPSIERRRQALVAFKKIVEEWIFLAYSYDEMISDFEALKKELPEITSDKVC